MLQCTFLHMPQPIETAANAAKDASRRKELSSGSGRQHRTLSLRVKSYQLFKRICRANGYTVSEMVDEMIVSYVGLHERAPKAVKKVKK